MGSGLAYWCYWVLSMTGALGLVIVSANERFIQEGQACVIDTFSEIFQLL